MSHEPVWVEPHELIEINKVIVERSGEPYGIAIPGALEAACDRPRNTFLYEHEDDIVVLACLTLTAIADAHPFRQGNKRVALIGMEKFLHNNGYGFRTPDIRLISQAVIDSVEHTLAFDDLVEFFDAFIVELDEIDYHNDLLASMPSQLTYGTETVSLGSGYQALSTEGENVIFVSYGFSKRRRDDPEE